MKTKKPLELVQPNRVTSARHDYDVRQQNILTLMIDAVQKHISQDRGIDTDLFGEPTIVIDTADVGSNNKKHYWDSAEAMLTKTFEFEWRRPTDNRDIKTKGVLITTVHNVRGTSLLELTINKWAIPYLLYWGKGADKYADGGGTIFNKTTALTLKGEYTKRLYTFCKQWESLGGKEMPISEFRKMMCLENKYPKLRDLKRFVLDNSKERLINGADVYFNYSTDNIGGSRAQNQIYFTFIGNNKYKAPEKKTDMYVLAYNVLTIAFPSHTNSIAQDICDRVSKDPVLFEKLYKRMKGIKHDLDDYKKDLKQTIGLIKYVVKEDYS